MAPGRPLHPPIAAPLTDARTDRLELRRFRDDDLDALSAVFAEPAVWRFPYGRGLDRTETHAFLLTQLRAWDELGFGLWLAVERGSGRVVGYAGLSVPTFLPEVLPAVEVGWRLHPDVWGRGYATEAATAALDAAFTTLVLPQVCSLPQRDNPASVRVAERLGMRHERDVVIPANERRGAVTASLFVVIAAEWRTGRTGGGPA